MIFKTVRGKKIAEDMIIGEDGEIIPIFFNNYIIRWEEMYFLIRKRDKRVMKALSIERIYKCKSY